MGGYFIYLYAGSFAVTASIIINCSPGTRLSQKGTKFSGMVGMIGTGFVFSTFPYTDYNMIVNGNTPHGAYVSRYYSQ